MKIILALIILLILLFFIKPFNIPKRKHIEIIAPKIGTDGGGVGWTEYREYEIEKGWWVTAHKEEIYLYYK